MEVYFTLRTQHKFYLLELGFMQDSITDKEISEISVIALQRCEEFYKLTKGSVVCSNHFLESDDYVTTKGIRRLHKTAVTRIKTNDDDDCSLKNKSSDQSFSESQINIESRISPTSLLSIVSIRDTLKEKH
ncbi:jg3867 [Pararge aegeria aegeria]|uniref:Jg3867 protein n=1 Tax=Pararge aegeria aegeria TaxID=348720 RepID=A0A8S4S5J2_9NEOP|nr:jg3867 [Pararge aegeria aegeria]